MPMPPQLPLQAELPPSSQSYQCVTTHTQEGAHGLTKAHVQANAFELEGDLSGFAPYQRGGIVTQHKAPKQLAFRPLQQALADPGELMLTDFSKIERPGLLHLGFQALDAFQVCSAFLSAAL